MDIWEYDVTVDGWNSSKKISEILSFKTKFTVRDAVSDLQNAFKKKYKVKYAIAMNSGASCLHAAMYAVGVKPGDEIICPSWTYIATAEAPAQLGATPFFVDVSYDSFNMDPSSFKQAIIDCKRRGLNSAAVIPVDLFGQPANVDQISTIAKSEGIKVLIDGAQSFGAMYNGKKNRFANNYWYY